MKTQFLSGIFRPRGYVLLIVLLVGCAGPATEGDIADLHRLPQDAWHYVNPAAVDEPLLEPEQQKVAARRFLDRHFSPWQSNREAPPGEEVFAPLKALLSGKIYGVNLLPYPAEEKARLVMLCDEARYPGPALRAITVRNTDLRSLPTRNPGFLNPRKAGEGFPFDYFQYSAIRANTPLRIIHRSSDGAWCLVVTPHVTGWLPASDVATVDGQLMARFKSGSYLTVVQEEAALHDAGGNFRQKVSIGALLPLTDASAHRWRVLIAVSDADGQAVLREAYLPRVGGDRWPLPATPRTMANLANRLLGQAYGWGGLYGGRDCSSTLQDLFASIGLSLPRNSARQIENGRTVSLRDLPLEKKEQQLLAQGQPFMTLVGMPGHILLYLGEKDGQAVVLHTLWGLRTGSAGRKNEGRHLVGRTVITSLHAGRELSNLARPEGNLLQRVHAFSLLSQEAVKVDSAPTEAE